MPQTDAAPAAKPPLTRVTTTVLPVVGGITDPVRSAVESVTSAVDPTGGAVADAVDTTTDAVDTTVGAVDTTTDAVTSDSSARRAAGVIFRIPAENPAS